MTGRTRRLAIEWAALALAMMAAASTRSSAQTPIGPPPARSSAPASGVLKGRVTAAANGAALPRVRLTLTGPIPNPITTVSDSRGEFEITDVPAGVYTLTASRTGYLPLQYGQTRPRQAGRTIQVRASDTVDGLDFSLQYAASVAGRITDDVADPFANVKVEALEARTINGRRVSVAVATTRTNDLGEYLLSGLPPGRYTVRASSASEAWQDEGPVTLKSALSEGVTE